MATITVTWNSSDLVATNGLNIVSIERPAGSFRSEGVQIPGVDGFLTALTPNVDRSPLIIRIEAKITSTSIAALKTALFVAEYKTLAFGDQSGSYTARCVECNVDTNNQRPNVTYVTITWLASPPCLIGSEDTDSGSPTTVANAGDYRCPCILTVTATGNGTGFSFTVGGMAVGYTGALVTNDVVTINTGTCTVLLSTTAVPQYHSGGFPWLDPGNNTVAKLAGTVSWTVKHSPRYV